MQGSDLHPLKHVMLWRWAERDSSFRMPGTLLLEHVRSASGAVEADKDMGHVVQSPMQGLKGHALQEETMPWAKSSTE